MDCSVDSRGVSGLIWVGSEESETFGPVSLEDAELVGRVEEFESSWPKNAHFFGADLLADGLGGGGTAAASVSIGLELCRRGLGTSGAENDCVAESNLAAAVCGRAPVGLLVARGLPALSLPGLVDETIEDRLPAAECPARIVVPESLDINERGRGMTSISSANRICLGSCPIAGETGADSARGTFSEAGFRIRETSDTEIAAERLC